VQKETFLILLCFRPDTRYVIQRMDDCKTISVSLNKRVKPSEIDSLGIIALNQELSPCDIDHLRDWENDFTKVLLNLEPEDLFTLQTLRDFDWQPNSKHDHIKSDVLNKNLPHCK